MKKNLEILEIEAKLTKDEKKYWRVKTQGNQWMSCFDEVTQEILKSHIGCPLVCCEVTEKEGTNFRGEPTVFYNITKCYGEAEKLTLSTPMDKEPEVVKMMNRSEAVIAAYKAGKDYKPNGNGSMYASYAKDVFCAIVKEDKNVHKTEDLMEAAIALVKQAKEAFE